MFCANCGNKLIEGAAFCGNCGAAVTANASSTANNTTHIAGNVGSVSNVIMQSPVPVAPPREFVTTWLLSWFLGAFGVDRFYLGYTGMGIGKLALTLFTVIGGVIWHTIDLILVLAGKMPDAQGRQLIGYNEKKRMAIWVTVGVSVGGIVLTLILVISLIAAISSSAANYY